MHFPRRCPGFGVGRTQSKHSVALTSVYLLILQWLTPLEIQITIQVEMRQVRSSQTLPVGLD